MQKDVTIKDIALQTQFSVNTVSRALRNMPDISNRTKAVILAKAEEMGYKKNYMASTLRTNKSHIIGVIMPDIKNPIYGGIYKGIRMDIRCFWRIPMKKRRRKNGKFTPCSVIWWMALSSAPQWRTQKILSF